MAWNCSIQINGFDMQACGMGARKEFAGFCLWDAEIVHAIRSKDPRILDALNDCLDEWEELCGMMWSNDEVFWNLDMDRELSDPLADWWERCLEAIAQSDSASEVKRKRARKVLVDLSIRTGDFSLLAEDVGIDCTEVNALLSHYDCLPPKFYERLEYLPPAPGVYLLWKDKGLDYIGQSVNIKKRLAHHRVYEKDEHLIGLVQISPKEKREVVEIALIGALHPAQNIKWSLK
jgi:hypothetical protein